MLAAQDVDHRDKELGITALYINSRPQEEIGPRLLDQGLNLGLLHGQVGSLPLSHHL